MFGIVVVLEHEDARRVGDDRHVHRFEGRALVARPVAREGDRDAPFPVELVGQRRANRDRRACADDAVGTQHALVDIGDMHGAALALAQAFGAAPDFLHHPLHIAALGKAVPVAAVGGDDLVFGIEMFAHAHGHRFLAAIEVGEPGDLAGGDHIVQAFLERPDRGHPSIGL